jgi:hypothetical protein
LKSRTGRAKRDPGKGRKGYFSDEWCRIIAGILGLLRLDGAGTRGREGVLDKLSDIDAGFAGKELLCNIGEGPSLRDQ